ncbi:MAG: hypothetical protein RLY43_89 [Bacteroidota bacterium]
MNFRFFFIGFTCFGQMLLHNDTEGTFPTIVTNSSSTSGNLAPAPTYTDKVYNIYFHSLKDSNGDILIGEEEIMNAVRDLNVAFNQFRIFFKYRGSNDIPAPEYLDLRHSGNPLSPNLPTPHDLNDYSIVNGFQSDNAINIFVVHNIWQYANGVEIILPGFTSPFYNSNVNSNMPNLFLMKDFFNTGVLVHEMAHVFGARHTNHNGVGLTPPTTSVCEYVNRTYSSDPFVYNATYAGDGVEDTYASPSEYLDEDVDASGVYVGLQRDCSGVFLGTDGVLYKTYQVPIKNFMNVNRLEDIQFQGEFTVGQGLRMRVLIDSGSLDSVLLLTETTVASLYEPFETSFVAGMYVISTNDLGNGYAEVCRNRLEKHRFQKGFDYTFPENDGNPDQVTADINVIPFDVNHTYNYPIVISQVDPNYVGTVLVDCTRGVVCAEEEFVSGTDMITDFIGSYNFTIDQWDKLKVSDPNLYDYLENNKYHIIKKETKTGVIIEVLIYKQ